MPLPGIREAMNREDRPKLKDDSWYSGTAHQQFSKLAFHPTITYLSIYETPTHSECLPKQKQDRQQSSHRLKHQQRRMGAERGKQEGMERKAKSSSRIRYVPSPFCYSGSNGTDVRRAFYPLCQVLPEVKIRSSSPSSIINDVGIIQPTSQRRKQLLDLIRIKRKRGMKRRSWIIELW